MKIAMANDHAGTKLKQEIKAYLESKGHEVVDFGTYEASTPACARIRSARRLHVSTMTQMSCASAER